MLGCVQGFVNKEFLARAPAGVRLINVARGVLLDYDATLEALNSGHLGGLGTDVAWKVRYIIANGAASCS